jgi:hypothetical protein
MKKGGCNALIPCFRDNIDGIEMKASLGGEHLMESTRFSLQISNNDISSLGKQIQAVILLDGSGNRFGKISPERFIRIDDVATRSLHVQQCRP